MAGAISDDPFFPPLTQKGYDVRCRERRNGGTRNFWHRHTARRTAFSPAVPLHNTRYQIPQYSPHYKKLRAPTRRRLSCPHSRETRNRAGFVIFPLRLAAVKPVADRPGGRTVRDGWRRVNAFANV